VKARELERKKAIAEGKMDDPSVPKRLEDAISIVGTCFDMCPRFERYRRERENNLFEWETVCRVVSLITNYSSGEIYSNLSPRFQERSVLITSVP
jgi:hypothetical protein